MVGAVKQEISGGSDLNHISTSYVERHNLMVRMHMPLHSADECVLKEDREPRVRGGAPLNVLQFRPPRSNAESRPRNGRWRHGSALGNDRCCGRARRF